MDPFRSFSPQLSFSIHPCIAFGPVGSFVLFPHYGFARFVRSACERTASSSSSPSESLFACARNPPLTHPPFLERVVLFVKYVKVCERRSVFLYTRFGTYICIYIIHMYTYTVLFVNFCAIVGFVAEQTKRK